MRTLVLAGCDLHLRPHRAHAYEIAIALSGTFAFRRDDRCDAFTAALIAPDVEHELDGRGADLCVVFIAPESRDGRRFQELRELSAGVAALCSTRASALRAMLADDICRAITNTFAPPFARTTTDPRVLDVLSLIERSPGFRVPLREIADAVCLSPGRLSHLFCEQTGVSIKRYSLWLRVVAAAQRIIAGCPLAVVSDETGFSDYAHMSRAFREMLGCAPSDLRGRALFAETAAPFIRTSAAFNG